MAPVSSYDLLQQVAMFGEKRQQVLAENIANIDTPGYKTRDLDVVGFQTALKKVLEIDPRSSALSPQQHLEEIGRGSRSPSEISSGNVTFQDGNNRSIEREVTEMTKNLLMQNMAVELMSAQTNTLAAVISERP